MSSLLQGNGEGYPLIFKIQIGLIILAGGLLAMVRIPAIEEETSSVS